MNLHVVCEWAPSQKLLKSFPGFAWMYWWGVQEHHRCLAEFALFWIQSDPCCLYLLKCSCQSSVMFALVCQHVVHLVDLTVQPCQQAYQQSCFFG